MATTDTREQEPMAEIAAASQHLRRYLRFLGCERSALDDLVQETLLAALRHWPAGSVPVPWLFTTARNCLRMHWRRHSAQRELADVERLHRMWVDQAGLDAGEAKRSALRECVAGLPGRSRLLLQLRYEQGCDRSSIARRLGLGVEGVKSLLERVRHVLAACVERRLRDD